MKKVFIYGEEEQLANYAAAVRGVGGEPVFSKELADAAACDGLLLPGGGDVDPNRYGQENTASAGIDPQRDGDEIALIHIFLETGRPILGICRGMQVLNVSLGGTLVQDVPHTETHKWQEMTGDRVHAIAAEPDCFLRPLYGEKFAVNSAHHQAVDRPGDALKVTARTLDGTPEALEWPEKRLYAVQFHPERMAFAHRRTDTVDGQSIFEFFLGIL